MALKERRSEPKTFPFPKNPLGEKKTFRGVRAQEGSELARDRAKESSELAWNKAKKAFELAWDRVEAIPALKEEEFNETPSISGPLIY